MAAHIPVKSLCLLFFAKKQLFVLNATTYTRDQLCHLVDNGALLSWSVYPGNAKGGSITEPLTSCFTGLDQSALKIKTKIVSSHTADSKPVKQEVNGTEILSPLVFPGLSLAVKARNIPQCRGTMVLQEPNQCKFTHSFCKLYRFSLTGKLVHKNETVQLTKEIE